MLASQEKRDTREDLQELIHKIMHIDSYKIGQITIDGSEYEYDILVYPEDDVVMKWERIENHELDKDDLEDIDIVTPDILIVGTGNNGELKISSQIREYLEELGIELIEAKTKEAIKIFNDLQKEEEKRVIGGFHLTC